MAKRKKTALTDEQRIYRQLLGLSKQAKTSKTRSSNQTTGSHLRGSGKRAATGNKARGQNNKDGKNGGHIQKVVKKRSVKSKSGSSSGLRNNSTKRKPSIKKLLLKQAKKTELNPINKRVKSEDITQKTGKKILHNKIFGQSVSSTAIRAIEDKKRVGVIYKGVTTELTPDRLLEFELMFNEIEAYYIKKAKAYDQSPQLQIDWYKNLDSGDMLFDFDNIDLFDEDVTEELNDEPEFKKTKTNFRNKLKSTLTKYGIAESKKTTKSKRKTKNNSKKS